MQRTRRMLGAFMILAVMATSSAVTAETNLAVNGSFESPVVAGNWNSYSAGQTFGDWTLSSGSVDLVAGYWTAASGGQSVDMSGNNAGAIYQDIATTPGGTYELKFAIAGNPECGSPVKSLSVQWGDQPLDTVTFDTTGKSKTDMGWVYSTYSVEAAGATTRLQFSSNESSACGPVLDDVSLVAVAVTADATLDCDPDTLNKTAEGAWVTCYVEFAGAYDVEQIDGSTVMLNEQVSAYLGQQGWAQAGPTEGNILDHNGNGIPERMVKFAWTDVADMLEAGDEVTLTLTGEVGGVSFAGSDTIRVIEKTNGRPSSEPQHERQPNPGRTRSEIRSQANGRP